MSEQEAAAEGEGNERHWSGSPHCQLSRGLTKCRCLDVSGQQEKGTSNRQQSSVIPGPWWAAHQRSALREALEETAGCLHCGAARLGEGDGQRDRRQEEGEPAEHCGRLAPCKQDHRKTFFILLSLFCDGCSLHTYAQREVSPPRCFQAVPVINCHHVSLGSLCNQETIESSGLSTLQITLCAEILSP